MGTLVFLTMLVYTIGFVARVAAVRTKRPRSRSVDAPTDRVLDHAPRVARPIFSTSSAMALGGGRPALLSARVNALADW